jgi:hypothetical protein
MLACVLGSTIDGNNCLLWRPAVTNALVLGGLSPAGWRSSSRWCQIYEGAAPFLRLAVWSTERYTFRPCLMYCELSDVVAKLSVFAVGCVGTHLERGSIKGSVKSSAQGQRRSFGEHVGVAHCGSCEIGGKRRGEIGYLDFSSYRPRAYCGLDDCPLPGVPPSGSYLY